MQEQPRTDKVTREEFDAVQAAVATNTETLLGLVNMVRDLNTAIKALHQAGKGLNEAGKATDKKLETLEAKVERIERQTFP